MYLSVCHICICIFREVTVSGSRKHKLLKLNKNILLIKDIPVVKVGKAKVCL